QLTPPSHTPAAAGHPVPAVPGASGRAGAPMVPLHMSLVQTLPSSVQVVPAVLTASTGQVALEPVQLSARSHSLTAARHTVAAVTNVHVAVQQEPDWPFCGPRSHCSPASTWPSP